VYKGVSEQFCGCSECVNNDDVIMALVGVRIYVQNNLPPRKVFRSVKSVLSDIWSATPGVAM